MIQISKLQNGNTVFSFEEFFFEHFPVVQSDLDLSYSFSAKLKEYISFCATLLTYNLINSFEH